MSLHPATLTFLSAIQEHNSRNYFASIKPVYQDIMHDLMVFCDTLIQNLIPFNPDLTGLTAKDCLFRIYRDARRLKEGDLIYKSNFGFVIAPGGKKSTSAGYYVHLQPGASFFGGGIYQPQPNHILNLRHFLSVYGAQYYDITEQRRFKKHFGEVQGDSGIKLPKGFESDSLYPELVKKKQFLIYHKYTDPEVLSDDFMDHIAQDCMIAKPLFDFLNQGCEYDRWKIR